MFLPFRNVCAACVALWILFFTTPVSAQEKIIKIDGSSTVYPVTEAVAEEFQKETDGRFKVTVGISGTGGGFKKFTRGEIDIADASRPILKQEMEEARKNGITFIELPVAFDALTVMVNPMNHWVDHITVDELKKIWEPAAQGKIVKWNQVRAGFPDAPIRLYGAGADSGTCIRKASTSSRQQPTRLPCACASAWSSRNPIHTRNPFLRMSPSVCVCGGCAAQL